MRCCIVRESEILGILLRSQKCDEKDMNWGYHVCLVRCWLSVKGAEVKSVGMKG